MPARRFIKTNLTAEITSSARLSAALGWVLRRHTMLSFALYTAGFIAFVLTLKKQLYMYQFGQFAWTHMIMMASLSRWRGQGRAGLGQDAACASVCVGWPVCVGWLWHVGWVQTELGSARHLADCAGGTSLPGQAGQAALVDLTWCASSSTEPPSANACPCPFPLDGHHAELLLREQRV